MSEAEATLSPSWPPPRSPLPPHRLAKLANALGISTPVPGYTFNDSPSTPEPWRSPTPSNASSVHLRPHSPMPSSTSKFLLHVIPPVHLPHDTDASDSLSMTPPPSNASGYHTQFRRGTLVPLFPSLQSQLWAIAKEYALPSTAGMILYLVNTSPSRATSPSLVGSPVDPNEEPGPRLSEEIWKHLWTRVAKVEQDSFRAPSPNPIGLGIPTGTRFSPMLNADLTSTTESTQSALRPLVSPGRILPQPLATPITPNSSTHSSSSDQHNPSSTTSPSDCNTPDTSFPSGSQADSLELPGLLSSSIIPILAKVEFDIDRRKATWYDPWVRSRKSSHKKRVGISRDDVSMKSQSADGREESKTAPLSLKLVDRQAVPRFLRSDEREESDVEEEKLSESPVQAEGELYNDEFAEGDETLRHRAEDLDIPDRPRLSVTIPSSPPRRNERRSSPTTAGTIKRPVPPPLTLAAAPPTDVVFAELTPSPLYTAASSTGSTKLPYLRDNVPSSSDDDLLTQGEKPEVSVELYDVSSEGQDETDVVVGKSPLDEKRGGGFFEDLDLGLNFDDTGDFDTSDPHDRRRSQYVMKAQLDEIEKTLAQFSPRKLKHELEEDPAVGWHARSGSSTVASNTLTPPGGHARFLSASSGGSLGSPLRPDPSAPKDDQPPVWPAVPFSMLKNDTAPLSPEFEDFPAPPQLAVNGVSHAIPVSPYAKVNRSSAVSTASDESVARKREFEGDETTYPDIMPLPPSLRRKEGSNSPIIPLSPDPFGRFPSENQAAGLRPSNERDSESQESRLHYSSFEIPPERTVSLNRNTSDGSESQGSFRQPPSSRFSVDSDDPHGKTNPLSRSESRASAATLNPVKSIRKLWRKSNKASISNAFTPSTSPIPPTPTTPLASGRSTPVAPSPQPIQEVVTNAMIPPRRSLAPLAPYPEQTYMTTSQAAQKAREEASINFITFDQESPYPVRRSPSLQPSNASIRTATTTTAAHRSQVSVSSSSSIPPPSVNGAMERERESGSARKSILKSWKKSPPSSLSKISGSSTGNGSSSDGRTSTESMSPVRKRRPSVIEFVSGNRSSLGAGSVLSEIPPSPILPEQYIAANAVANRTSKHSHTRMQSVVDANGKRSTGTSSFESSASSSLLASPPRTMSRDRLGPEISRGSQEDERLDMIDAQKAVHSKAPSLSYSYHELDHQA